MIRYMSAAFESGFLWGFAVGVGVCFIVIWIFIFISDLEVRGSRR